MKFYLGREQKIPGAGENEGSEIFWHRINDGRSQFCPWVVLYNIFDYRFKRNIEVNKDISFIKENTSHLTF